MEPVGPVKFPPMVTELLLPLLLPQRQTGLSTVIRAPPFTVKVPLTYTPPPEELVLAVIKDASSRFQGSAAFYGYQGRAVDRALTSAFKNEVL
jgi:hypothetical protein